MQSLGCPLKVPLWVLEGNYKGFGVPLMASVLTESC